MTPVLLEIEPSQKFAGILVTKGALVPTQRFRVWMLGKVKTTLKVKVQIAGMTTQSVVQHHRVDREMDVEKIPEVRVAGETASHVVKNPSTAAPDARALNGGSSNGKGDVPACCKSCLRNLNRGLCIRSRIPSRSGDDPTSGRAHMSKVSIGTVDPIWGMH